MDGFNSQAMKTMIRREERKKYNLLLSESRKNHREATEGLYKKIEKLETENRELKALLPKNVREETRITVKPQHFKPYTYHLKKMTRVVETFKNPMNALGQLFHACDAIQESLIEKEDLADFSESLPTASETRFHAAKASKQVRLSRDVKKAYEFCHTGEKS